MFSGFGNKYWQLKMYAGYSTKTNDIKVKQKMKNSNVIGTNKYIL